MVLKLAGIKDGQEILEVACGIGRVFKRIVGQNPNGQNIGIDLSPEMLKRAKKALQKSKSTNYELKEGDVLNLDFPDNSFDILVNNFMVAKKVPDLLTGCRPVTIKENLIEAGFTIEKDLELSQNTWPSGVIKARKLMPNNGYQ